MLADDDLPEVVSIVSTNISECIRDYFPMRHEEADAPRLIFLLRESRWRARH